MKIKECFTSRFDNGYLIEADYSQLEVRMLAILSGCPALVADLIANVDIHRVLAAKLYHKHEDDVTAGERKLVKALTFQLQYGAGPASMAKQWGISETTAKMFIDTYYARYPLVKVWQTHVTSTLEAGDLSGKDAAGYPCHYGTFQGMWDPITFTIDSETYARGKSKVESYSPTKMKNYPVQGAAAQLMLLVLDEMRRSFYASDLRGLAVPINTVHDSIMFDSEESAMERVAIFVKKQMEAAPLILQNFLGIDTLGVPFPVEVKVGANWGNMEVIMVD